MDHSLAQVFGAGLSAIMAYCDFMGGTIIVDYHRMIDGDVGGTLLELTHWISFCLHQLAYKTIGLGNSAFRIVDKL
jgi:hypothetical protein